MATPVRYFQKDAYYHIYNRGNRKQNIFVVRRDYERFLKKTLEYKNDFNVTILCYCLMPNHFHFLVRQNMEVSLSKFMLRLSTSYAKYFNIKYEEVGSLFQSRFQAKFIETEEYLLELSRYIHRNPKELLPSTPGVELADYKWSSYPAYLGLVKDELIDISIILDFFSRKERVKDYKSFVEYDFKDEDLLSISELIFDS